MSGLKRRGEDRGASTLEFVIVTPMLLLFLMLAVQFALVAHAQNSAQMAADEGAASVRAYNGTVGAGQAKAERYLDELAGSMFTGHSISGNRTATEASITVTATVKSMVPGFHPRVSHTSTGTVERFAEEQR